MTPEEAYIDPETGALTIPNVLRRTGPAATKGLPDGVPPPPPGFAVVPPPPPGFNMVSPSAPQANPAAAPPTEPQDVVGAFVQGHKDSELARRQNVSPYALSKYAPAQPTKLGELEEFDVGSDSQWQGYRQGDQQITINPKTDFVMRDPATGKLTVYSRHGYEATQSPAPPATARDKEARALTNQPIASRAQEVLEGWVTGPVAGAVSALKASANNISRPQYLPGTQPVGIRGALQRTFQGPAPNAGQMAPMQLPPPSNQALVPGASGLGPGSGATGAELAAARADSAARDRQSFRNMSVRPYGPAFTQGPVAGIGQQLSETALIGAPLRNARDQALYQTRQAAQDVAGRFGPPTSEHGAGQTVQSALDRYRNANPGDVVPRAAGGYTPAQSRAIISQPSRATSAKTKSTALYDRAWSRIPEEMREGGSHPDLPRVMGGMPETRRTLQAVQDRNSRLVMQSGDLAPRHQASTRPISTGGLVGNIVETLMNLNYRAALQTMRDHRSNFRRLASGIADSEKNTLLLSDYDAINAAISRDMVNLLERNVNRYADLARNAATAAERAQWARTSADIRRAIHEFRRADQFYRAAAQRMARIEDLFNARSAEQLYRNIVSAALSKGRGDIEKLLILKRTLRAEEFDDLVGGIVREMGTPRGSVRGVNQEIGFSADTFLTSWLNMSPQAQTILFGGAHREAINDFVRVVSRLANVEAQANKARTFTQGMNTGGAVGILGLIGTALATGKVSSTLGVALGMASGGLGLSILMSRALYTRWLVTYTQLRSRLSGVTHGSTADNARIASHINKLASYVRHDPQLAPIYRAIAEENGIPLDGDVIGVGGAGVDGVPQGPPQQDQTNNNRGHIGAPR